MWRFYYEYKWLSWLIPLLWLVPLGGVVWFATIGRRKLNLAMEKALERSLSSVQASLIEKPDYVHIRFPVYACAVVVVYEVTPDVWVPVADAKRVVHDLVKISLKYGLLGLWAPYVLASVLINYLLHLGKLRG